MVKCLLAGGAARRDRAAPRRGRSRSWIIWCSKASSRWRGTADERRPDAHRPRSCCCVANLALFGYTRLDSAGSGEGARLAQQVQPDRIRLLTPQQVATLGPAKVAALADVCLEWGPFNDADRARALAELEPAGLGRLLTQKRVENDHRVLGVRAASREQGRRGQARRRAARPPASRSSSSSTAGRSGSRSRSASSAPRRRPPPTSRSSRRLGIADARAGPRQQVVVQTLLVVRDPAAAGGRPREGAAAGYPGSEIMIGACEKT